MIFHPKSFVATVGRFILRGEISAVAHSALERDVMLTLWRSFTYQTSTLSLSRADGYVFSIGEVDGIALDGYDYTLHIEEGGLCILAKDATSLVHGFMTLLDRIYAVDLDGACVGAVDCCDIRDRASVRARMVHFCIFPETELWELQRFIRLVGVLKYTHVVLEFWGALRYDCMQELSWRSGYIKDEIRPILREARDLGLEVIPMFNHWGHASSSRAMHGKHVVLDQNPSLQTYFSEDGWCWDYSKSKVRELLRQVRGELIELCGEGGYFHLGCDEAYSFDYSTDSINALCDYVNGVADELAAEGRRAILWGDMMLYRYPHYSARNNYTCAAPTPQAEEAFLLRLDKRIVIADWQYWAPQNPVETASVFRRSGFDTLLCPSDTGMEHTRTALSTVVCESLMGFIHTTWHTLTRGMPYVTLMGVGGYDGTESLDPVEMMTKTAALLRKVMPAEGDYERAGWSKEQIGFQW